MGSWTHPICGRCWVLWQPGREPYQMTEEHREDETCCWCGRPTREGIYARRDPRELPRCGGHDD